MNNVKYLPISWLILGKQAFGLCGYNNSVISVKSHNDVGVFIMRDLYHDYTSDGVKCEEGNRCINYKCEYNTSNDRVEAVRSLLVNNNHFTDKEADNFINEVFPTKKNVKTFNRKIKNIEDLVEKKGLKPSMENALFVIENVGE